MCQSTIFQSVSHSAWRPCNWSTDPECGRPDARCSSSICSLSSFVAFRQWAWGLSLIVICSRVANIYTQTHINIKFSACNQPTNKHSFVDTWVVHIIRHDSITRKALVRLIWETSSADFARVAVIPHRFRWFNECNLLYVMRRAKLSREIDKVYRDVGWLRCHLGLRLVRKVFLYNVYWRTD